MAYVDETTARQAEAFRKTGDADARSTCAAHAVMIESGSSVASKWVEFDLLCKRLLDDMPRLDSLGLTFLSMAWKRGV
jgi:hypothetical protein